MVSHSNPGPMGVSTILIAAVCLVAACQPITLTPRASPSASPPTEAPTAEPELSFPTDVNPLSGLRVADPFLLQIPALLVSISHFPATARPQAGLSFAPFVYEYYITEGATRFLAVFYGEFPQPEEQVYGGCATRTGPFVQTATLLGNRVWLDLNGNGIQDPGEEGISGLCMNLYDASGNLIARASSDSNGYYGFNVQPGKYSIEYVKPQNMDFTKPNVGDDSSDSDADPTTGRATVSVSSDDLSVDAGMVYARQAAPTSDPASLPLAQVGPVRSGRLIYSYIADYFQNSCLIYAFASEEVLARLPQCHMVFHELTGGGYMMELSEMRSVAQENLTAKGSDFNYTSNVYSADVPSNGSPASLLKVYIAYQNQSGWAYDPLSQSYLRYVDTSEYDQAGVLHPDTDRLTGRQLHVENLIVLYAQHEVVSPTNLDIHLDQGKTGKAVLFRNGEMFKIKWSTVQGKTGEVRPIRFLRTDGQPISLEPGHTWVIVVTADSKLEETTSGEWLLSFAQPPGAK
jgi:hypothetical protein